MLPAAMYDQVLHCILLIGMRVAAVSEEASRSRCVCAEVRIGATDLHSINATTRGRNGDEGVWFLHCNTKGLVTDFFLVTVALCHHSCCVYECSGLFRASGPTGLQGSTQKS